MRLFDKCLTQLSPRDVRDDFARQASSASVLSIDCIAAYVDSQSGWKSMDFDAYPHSFPPWKKTFVEWNVPEINYVPVEVVAGDDKIVSARPQQVGALVIRLDEGEPAFSATRDVVLGREYTRDFKVSRDATEPESWIAKCQTILTIYTYTFLNGLTEVGNGMALVGLGAGGEVGPWLGLHEPFKQRGSEEVLLRLCGSTLDSILDTVMLAFTFLNCSNVKLQDVTEDLEPPPKIKRRLRIPDVKRYTLNINGHFSRPRRELGEPGEKDVMPFHLCRGHFATYTDAAPLFGKYTGRFWIPPHTKGKKENGVIEKDYAIVN